MKTLRIATILLFVAVLALPIALFNHAPNSVSVIDNRKLAEDPFSVEGDLTKNVENYVNDRIGLRDSMISAYTILNDALFGKMVHPSYKYGEDGIVFGAGLTTQNDFGEFHIVFADMVRSVQDYCESRGIPFLFVFNPAKPAVYQDQIPEGIHYDREWVEQFFAELDKREINYLDNTEVLTDLASDGIAVFNRKYDANHWNDLGAFYGTQSMLLRLQEDCPQVHVNDLTEFALSEKLETSLPVSFFPINEYVPVLKMKTKAQSLTNVYSAEIQLHPSYKGFGYYVNEERLREGTPRALVFQGSYMNNKGYQFLINAFGEYIHVHDYQNVIDLPYYFNIFQPECVIFEVAEYTFSEKYFSLDKMKAIDYNLPLESLPDDTYMRADIDRESIEVTRGDALTTILWKTDTQYEYVWLELDHEYDMRSVKGGYQVTVPTEDWEKNQRKMEVFVSVDE